MAIQGAATRRGPLVFRGVEANRVHDMLYDFDEGDAGRHEPEMEVGQTNKKTRQTDKKQKQKTNRQKDKQTKQNLSNYIFLK